jgi:hypothetical protein
MHTPRINRLTAVVALGTVFLPLAASNSAALAASPRQALAIGTQLAELRGSDIVAGDGFGAPVAISGTTAVIGAWRHAKKGRAYVFTETNGTWKRTAELKGSDTLTGDDFGSSVAISGLTAIVGAPGYAYGGGRAYVFTDKKGTWKQVAELKGSDTYDGAPGCVDLCSGGSFFATSVAISGRTAVVGATVRRPLLQARCRSSRPHRAGRRARNKAAGRG